MTDCYYEKKDWRACTKEVSSIWKQQEYVARDIA